MAPATSCPSIVVPLILWSLDAVAHEEELPGDVDLLPRPLRAEDHLLAWNEVAHRLPGHQREPHRFLVGEISHHRDLLVVAVLLAEGDAVPLRRSAWRGRAPRGRPRGFPALALRRDRRPGTPGERGRPAPRTGSAWTPRWSAHCDCLPRVLRNAGVGEEQTARVRIRGRRSGMGFVLRAVSRAYPIAPRGSGPRGGACTEVLRRSRDPGTKEWAPARGRPTMTGWHGARRPAGRRSARRPQATIRNAAASRNATGR